MKHSYSNKAVPTPVLYPCDFCQKKFDKQRYFEHVICQDKCASVIQRVYDDARRENVQLRKRAGAIGEQTQEFINNQQAQIVALSRTIERNNEQVKQLNEEVEACRTEKKRLNERHSEFVSRETQLQKEMEQLKMKHYEEIQLLMSQQDRERALLQTSLQQQVDKEGAQRQRDKIHFEQELKTLEESWRAKLKQEMKEREQIYINDYNAIKTAHEQQVADLKSQMKQQLKTQSEELCKVRQELDSKTDQLHASRVKISELVGRVHELEVAIIERKQEHQAQLDQVHQNYSTQVSQLHSKLKLSNQIHSQDVEAMKQIQLKHSAEQIEWENERKIYHAKIRQCHVKHNGHVDAYAELNDKLDQILSFYRQVIAKEGIPPQKDPS